MNISKCIEELDEMSARHFRLNEHMENGGDPADKHVMIRTQETLTLVRACTDLLYEAVPEGSSILKDWDLIGYETDNIWQQLTVLGTAKDLARKRDIMMSVFKISK